MYDPDDVLYHGVLIISSLSFIKAAQIQSFTNGTKWTSKAVVLKVGSWDPQGVLE